MESPRHILELIFSATLLLLISFFSPVMAVAEQQAKAEVIQNVTSNKGIQVYGQYVVDDVNLLYNLSFLNHSLPVPVAGLLTFQQVTEANCSRKPNGDTWCALCVAARQISGQMKLISAKLWDVRHSHKLKLLEWKYINSFKDGSL